MQDRYPSPDEAEVHQLTANILAGIQRSDLPTFMAAVRHLSNVASDALDESRATGASVVDPQELTGLAFSKALERLPSADPEKARQVFGALSADPAYDVRFEAAPLLPVVTRANPGFGLRLWRNLIRDRADNIREWAYLPLAEALALEGTSGYGKSDEAIAADCAEIGLTVDEGRELLAAFEVAQRGENLYDPGAEALARLIAAGEQIVPPDT